jgi:NhaP-type Na+/H+ and K+/H+ antiporter
MLRFLFSVFQPGFLAEVPTLDLILYPFAILAMFAASYTAILQRDLKRMLAYSSIGQVGYMLLGIALLSESGLMATMIHLFNHGITKAALFMGVGVYVLNGSGSFYHNLRGRGKTMPWTSAAMVVAGLIIGNLGRKLAMNDMTRRYLDGFWELLDDMLNALLFALIGMELLLLPFNWLHVFAASLLAVAILLSRLLTVAPAILLLRRWRTVPRGTIRILTWGGLRGGVSVALALALPLGPERDLLLSITYIVVLSSILLQGLSIGKLVKRVTRDEPQATPEPH